MDNNLVFKLNFDDFNHLFKISGLRGNNLSPFKTDIEQSTNENPSNFFQELLKSDNLQEFSEIILEPDLVINFKSGGSISEKDFYQVFFSKKHSKIIAQFKNSENLILEPLNKNVKFEKLNFFGMNLKIDQVLKNVIKYCQRSF